ncbi:PAS domain S-box protein [Leptolyngbya sp. FACHB-541]|uniref:CheR family methyltransferase n=1 Tax=Leptolyngbya sp. FACHB-541 TaxID=2692810 RepID=UPI00168678AE|nr:CheR family methyltransferase [Leptolyngbya sp. FACHB-541]MBD1999003.1 PAS domain S-box protein [Leptolyngbya sp. FACHB-541]
MNTNDEDAVFEALLDYLKRARGFDFTGYKRSSLKRRVHKRMASRGINRFEDYLDYLEVYPNEFAELFNTILINVTSFFRDQAAWSYLQEHIITSLIWGKPEDEPIRVWSAGCASGEEAYTLAIVLAEILGDEQFRQRVKVYATDVDEEALAQARQSSYSTKELEPVSLELRERYFEPLGDRFTFRADLRRSVIFGRHDLVQDAPISRLDLLVCRNALMYFNAEAQARILNRFHFALRDPGILFLGKAEMLLSHANLFTPTNLQHRIFSKVPRINLRDRFLSFSQANDDRVSTDLSSYVRLREVAFDKSLIPQMVVDVNGNLIFANSSLRVMFGLVQQDLGRPLQDLEISYRPLELRSQIEQVYANHQTIIVRDVTRQQLDGRVQHLDVRIAPLEDDNGEVMGASVAFTDVSRYHELQQEIQNSNQKLETANEELESSNEELETTNEELQSTNEELETTNEELQSTNEELETMNDELQSTNEELQTINDELRLRTQELNEANAFLNSILTSMKAGVIALNRQFQVISWNSEAENLWGLRNSEVQGESLFNLDMGLPVDQLRDMIRRSLIGEKTSLEITLDAVNRRGRKIKCRVVCNPMFDSEETTQGVILVMEEA